MANKNAYLDRVRREKEEFAAKVAHKAAIDAVNLMQHLSLVALNNVFGFGEERAERFLKELQAVAEEYDRECEEDYDLAKEHLRKVERVD